MSLDEMIALEEYQRSCACEMEIDIDRLTDAVDRMTTNAKTRDGRKIARARRHEVIEAMKKLHDLFVDMEAA